MVRIIAVDLDGTLLDSSKRLSAVNREALADAAAAGALVVPATGRFFGMMPECVRDLPFVRYAITVNGAAVYDRATGSATVREEIPLETAVEVMKLLDGYDVIYDCYRCDWGWMSEPFKAKAAAYATDEHYLKMVQDFRRPVPELKAHLAATVEQGDVQKIMLFTRLDAPRGTAEEIAREVSVRFPQLKVTTTTWNNLEINLASADKGLALVRFAESLVMSAADCMAIGDGGNDLSMIEAAGTGVAMANAHPSVIAAADWTAPSNDEDGVAAAVRRFVLDAGKEVLR